MEVDEPRAAIAEVQGLCTLLECRIHLNDLAAIAGMYRRFSTQGAEIRLMCHFDSAFALTFDGDGKLPGIGELEVLEASHGAIPHVGNKLVTTIHAVMTGLREVGMLLLDEFLIIPGNALL